MIPECGSSGSVDMGLSECVKKKDSLDHKSASFQEPVPVDGDKICV